ncbi:7897_t:CDS:2 [Acaulospora morrowiae]|uniref:7897_t:CDS:1 n=1 Tax=Acaulospora morrowiae TaxID=94023 RepID=A0A9N9EDT9_9GLOM|nr:7897_t:CDS:2 [Acaulospora morrowiae]
MDPIRRPEINIVLSRLKTINLTLVLEELPSASPGLIILRESYPSDSSILDSNSFSSASPGSIVQRESYPSDRSSNSFSPHELDRDFLRISTLHKSRGDDSKIYSIPIFFVM